MHMRYVDYARHCKFGLDRCGFETWGHRLICLTYRAGVGTKQDDYNTLLVLILTWYVTD